MEHRMVQFQVTLPGLAKVNTACKKSEACKSGGLEINRVRWTVPGAQDAECWKKWSEAVMKFQWMDIFRRAGEWKESEVGVSWMVSTISKHVFRIAYETFPSVTGKVKSRQRRDVHLVGLCVARKKVFECIRRTGFYSDQARVLWGQEKAYRKAIKKRKKQLYLDRVEMIERKLKELKVGDARNYWKVVRIMSNGFGNGPYFVKKLTVVNKDGVELEGTEAAIALATFYENQGKDRCPEGKDAIVTTEILHLEEFAKEANSNSCYLDSDITFDEVKTAVRCLKNGKATGLDNIPADFIKAGGEDFCEQVIFPMISIVWITEVYPKPWRKGMFQFRSRPE